MIRYVFVFCLYFSPALLAADLFSEASDAFSRGDIESAAKYFALLAEEDDSAEVLYNLAICYFKLERWNDARNLFLQLQKDDPTEDLVNYNLAITEKKLGNQQAAMRVFELIIQYSEDSSMVELSRRQVLRLSASPINSKVGVVNNWTLGAKAEAGYYDNLLTPTQEENTGISDSLLESQAYFRWQSDRASSNKWTVDGILYNSKFQETHRFDTKLAKLSVRKYNEWLQGYWSAGVSYDTSDLDDEGFLQNISIDLDLMQRHKRLGYWGLSYRYKDIEGLSQLYQPFTGHNQQFSAIWGGRFTSKQNWQLRYLYENNQRQDFQTLFDFRSFSPIRQGISFTWNYQVNQWRLNLMSEYRDSKFQDNNLYSNGISIKRDDQRFKSSFQAIWQLDDNWKLSAGYHFTDNQSNIELFDYHQHLAKLSLSWELN